MSCTFYTYIIYVETLTLSQGNLIGLLLLLLLGYDTLYLTTLLSEV